MEPILTKEEISELLSAVKDGRISTDSVDTSGPIIPPKPALDLDLFQIFTEEETGDVRIPNLDLVLDNFAKASAITLTSLLQRTFNVTRLDIYPSSFQESLAELNNEGAIAIYNLDPLKYGCLIHFDSLLSFSMLELMLGSSGLADPLELSRNLTTIEINVLKNTMVNSCGDLKRAFNIIVPLDVSLVKVENNFRLVSIVDPDAEVIITRFSVDMSGKTGEMKLILPYASLESIKDKFKDMATVAPQMSTWGKDISDSLLEMSTTLVARSGLIEMTIGQVMNLQEGDFLELGYDPDQPMTLVIEDKPKFLALPGTRNSKVAVHVTGRYTNRQGAIYGNT